LQKIGDKLKIFSLGGLNEIGKNMTVLEYGDDIIVIDCGLAFPEDEMLGIDLVIPDVSYLVKNQDKIRGLILTHAHDDHVGALPYVLKQLKNIPIYGTKLTLGIVGIKLEENDIKKYPMLMPVKAGDIIKLGCFSIELIKTNHSIPDAVSLSIETPVGIVFMTGDFKIDYTPIDGGVIDLHRIAEIGKKGVLVMLADSTNVERPGYTMSEKRVGETFFDIFGKAKRRILVATFASNIHRIQQIINAASSFDKKVAICGRSIENVVKVALDLGYLTIPDNLLIDIDDIKNLPDNRVVIITTGSQGEPMSALSRIATSEHKKVEIYPGDLVIISASPIPGNEKNINRLINQLFKQGAEVIYETLADVHVSGHACQEELKLIHTLVRPKYFVPVHGEHKHLILHAKIAEELGMSPSNIFIIDNGVVLEFNQDSARVSGRVTAGNVLVDGLGIGDVGNIVLRDRKHLAQDGLLVVVVTISKEYGQIVAGPDIISRGFVYVRESEDLMEECKSVIRNALNDCIKEKETDWATLKTIIKDTAKNYLYEKTKRKPMILPVIMEI